MMLDGAFSESDFNKIYAETYNGIVFEKNKNDFPKAYVLGGQPGAGKTSLQEIFSRQCENNLIVINGDEFRALHPDYKRLSEQYGKQCVEYTGAFSGKMTETLIEQLKTEKYNVLVEGTLRTAQVPLKTADEFKKSGYNVTLGIMAVKPQISYISTIFRYEKMIEVGESPRATAKENHDYVVSKIPENLKEIHEKNAFDNIVIYNRNGECLYDSNIDKSTSPDIVMNNVFYGKWTQNELNQYYEIGKCTAELMERRKAPELDDFKNTVFNKKIVSALAVNNNLQFSESMKEYFSEEIEEFLSLSAVKTKGKLSMRETQSNRLKLSETPKSRLQMMDAASLAKPNSKIKNDIER